MGEWVNESGTGNKTAALANITGPPFLGPTPIGLGNCSTENPCPSYFIGEPLNKSRTYFLF